MSARIVVSTSGISTSDWRPFTVNTPKWVSAMVCRTCSSPSQLAEGEALPIRSGSGVNTIRSMPDVPSSITSGTEEVGYERGARLQRSNTVRIVNAIRCFIVLPINGGRLDRFLSSLLLTTPTVSFRTSFFQHRVDGIQRYILPPQSSKHAWKRDRNNWNHNPTQLR